MQPSDLPPIPYRPEFAEEARKLALLGATDNEIARHFGIPPATLQEWLASVPEFAAAVRYGRCLADAEVIDRFRQLATGCFPEVVTRPVGPDNELVTYTRYRRAPKAARNFWLANREPDEWRWKARAEAKPRLDSARYYLTRSELERLVAGLPARGCADG